MVWRPASTYLRFARFALPAPRCRTGQTDLLRAVSRARTLVESMFWEAVMLQHVREQCLKPVDPPGRA